jgi:hypothetical protein
MSENVRNTKFAGFAKLLIDDLHPVAFQGLVMKRNDAEVNEQQQQIIAQRAFDLVAYALDYAFTNAVTFGTPEECAERIPDITAFSSEDK